MDLDGVRIIVDIMRQYEVRKSVGIVRSLISGCRCPGAGLLHFG